MIAASYKHTKNNTALRNNYFKSLSLIVNGNEGKILKYVFHLPRTNTKHTSNLDLVDICTCIRCKTYYIWMQEIITFML